MLRWTCNSVLRIVKQSKRAISSAPTPVIADKLKEENGKSFITDEKQYETLSEEEATKSRLVAAAFASLKKKTLARKITQNVLDEMISEAKTPEDLLSITDTASLSRRQALKVVTILAEWSVNGQVNMEKYEVDRRFISLCQQLGRPLSGSKSEKPPKSSDLSVVLGIAGDEEAAKLVSTISLQQMIKVMSSLAAKKRRSTPLLRSLSFNIGSSTAKVDVKQGADILYSMATLNFPDDILLEKVCSDLCECIPSCQKTAVIGSIATSLGLLKYKNSSVLNVLCEWMVKNQDLYRMQDIASLLHTLANVNYIPLVPENFFQSIAPTLKEEDFPSTGIWLDVVWSLTVLGNAENYHYESVLNPEFIKKFSAAQDGTVSFASRRKLLNVNGAAKWTKGYKGPLLEDGSDIKSLQLTRSKEKQLLITNVLDTLSNLFPSSMYLRQNVDTGMGFLMDGECYVDTRMTPLPVIDRKTGEPITLTKPQKGLRIAVMVWGYHDFTRGKSELSGPPNLNERLITLSGYKVLSIPYTEFSQSDKLTVRVQYLEKKLKALVKPG